MSKGFIPIKRTLFEHFLFNEHRVFSRFEAWLDLIQLASFTDGQTDLIKGKILTRDRGEVIASIRWIASRWNWSIHKTCDFIEVLRSQEMVVVGKEGGVTKISLVNFELHNSIGKDKKDSNGNSKRDAENEAHKGLDQKEGTVKGTQKGTVGGQAGDSEGTNYNKENNSKKEKEEGKGASAPPAPAPPAPASLGKMELKQKAMLEREKTFYESLVPHLATYGKEMIRAFYDRWREPNKSGTKMKFELEDTWKLELRLNTWANNDLKWNRGKGAVPPAPTSPTGPPPLSKTQLELNFLYERWLEDPGKVTVFSLDVFLYNQLKTDGHMNYQGDRVEEIRKMARAHMAEHKIEPGAETGLMKKFGVLEFFKTLKANGATQVYTP